MNTDYVERCRKAIARLDVLAEKAWNNRLWDECERLKGKRDGVKLALDYYLEMEKDGAS